ncbi:MAG: hypothetical protein HC849_13465 [Oscillatoriales cyanobacterium RU_3_3]|nr:hypothetical protein [Microcoleus sp. SM1_3_4]NJM60984.1 hypothetical protein [Oscillatoriales cyanobacterium RU_3_3]NJR25874.1 hypothetical protein [Richelia sp. CSU_2_1]
MSRILGSSILEVARSPIYFTERSPNFQPIDFNCLVSILITAQPAQP